MNTKDSPHFTLFQDRNLNGATFPARQPAWFSTEPEGEGMELCLRGFLVACLVAAVMICGFRIDGASTARHDLPALPDAHTAVACAGPVAPPAAKSL